MQIWNNIGASLTPSMTGPEAEKEFYRLRQKFGKERRKVTQSQPRSGAGANHTTYMSNWVLYNDLMFLADYIKPRQTSTNFQPSILKRKKAMASQMLQFTSSQLTSSQLVNSQLATSTSVTNPSACTPPLTSEEKTDLIWSIDCDYLDSESIIIAENEKASSIADSMESSSSKSFSNSLTSQSNASTNVAKATVSAITPKKLTPPADIKKRKRRTSDEVDAIMQESSKNISSLANTLEIALKEKITSADKKTELPHAVENMISGIALGLSKVREEHQIDCFISILACINEFIKK